MFRDSEFTHEVNMMTICQLQTAKALDSDQNLQSRLISYGARSTASNTLLRIAQSSMFSSSFHSLGDIEPQSGCHLVAM